MARTGMADFRSHHQMRPVDRRFLRRVVSLLRRPFRANDELWLPLCADRCQRVGRRDNDLRRLLHFLVQKGGRTPSEAHVRANTHAMSLIAILTSERARI